MSYIDFNIMQASALIKKAWLLAVLIGSKNESVDFWLIVWDGDILVEDSLRTGRLSLRCGIADARDLTDLA